MNKYEALKYYYGYDSFRGGQEEVVDAVLGRRDVMCVMPTGAGKSICYQIPALLFDGTAIVVSPLISLMKDQVASLVKSGVPAVYLNSSLSYEEYINSLYLIKEGNYKIIYVAPERLLVPAFLELCRSIDISMVAVDEAHCVSQWGQDFRPNYLRITQFISSLRKRPVVGAFTATATGEVKKDIISILQLEDPFCITTGFDRPNLFFSVSAPSVKGNELLRLIEARRDRAGIIYCATRKTVDEIYVLLTKKGYSAARYHAGMTDDERRRSQEDFVYDRKTVIVATNAFGMGIDKSNVSFVIHYNMPKNIESYYQEAGRAGRDGSEAECILLYSPRDVHINKFLINSTEANPDISQLQQEEIRKRELERLKYMTFYSTGTECLRAGILRYFGERTPDYCGKCSNCLNNYKTVDITVDAQKIMSCVYKTGQRFGAVMIADILKGSENSRLIRLGLNSQSTYGIMKDYSTADIRGRINALISEGYLNVTDSEYPSIVLTDSSWEVLRGRRLVEMKELYEDKDKRKKKAELDKISTKGTDGAFDEELLGALKTLRTEISKEERVPAYIIFPDSALIDMCQRKPSDIDEFLSVSGVGKSKQEKYGHRFLEVILKYTAGAAVRGNKDTISLEKPEKRASSAAGPESEKSSSLYADGMLMLDDNELNKAEIERIKKKLKELGILE